MKTAEAFSHSYYYNHCRPLLAAESDNNSKAADVGSEPLAKGTHVGLSEAAAAEAGCTAED